MVWCCTCSESIYKFLFLVLLSEEHNHKKLKLLLIKQKLTLEETQERINIEFQAAQNEYELAVETYFTNKENLALAKN